MVSKQSMKRRDVRTRWPAPSCGPQRALYLLALCASLAACATSRAGPVVEQSIAQPRYDETPVNWVDVEGKRLAYRSLGSEATEPPLLLLQHFTGTMDDWDPLVVEGLAKTRRVIVLDNAGVGSSGGATPDSIEAMAHCAEAFIEAMKFPHVDLLGFSMGGFIAQQILLERPALVRRAVLAGTSPRGGPGVKETPLVISEGLQKASEDKVHPKVVLFFTGSEVGKAAASAFLGRIGKHTIDPAPQASDTTTQAQLRAIVAWGSAATDYPRLEGIKQPILIVNGSNDLLDPTPNSFILYQHLSAAQLILFADSGHGALFQYHELFASHVNAFLASK